MRHFRLRHWIFTLAAGWAIAAADPALPQSRTPSGNDMALLDSIAALMFNLEEGRRTFPDNEPVKRQLKSRSITYSYVEPSRHYGATDADHKDVADSRYRRFTVDLRQPKPCVIEVYQTIDYSQGNSHEQFGEDASKFKVTFDLSKSRQFEFKMNGPAMALITMTGDDIVCTRGSDAIRNCENAYEQPVLVPGGQPFSEENAKEFGSRRLANVEVVLNACLPQAG
jgi:hypothetical protein